MPRMSWPLMKSEHRMATGTQVWFNNLSDGVHQTAGEGETGYLEVRHRNADGLRFLRLSSETHCNARPHKMLYLIV